MQSAHSTLLTARRFLLSSGSLTIVAIMFIWAYLLRIGRQDILLEAVTFKDLFSLPGVALIFSIILYCVLFFIVSIYSVLILHRHSPSDKNQNKLTRNYTLVLLAALPLSAAELIALIFYSPAPASALSFSLWALSGSLICIVLSLLINRNLVKTLSLFTSSAEKRRIKIRVYLATPAFLGITSWVFVFPLMLLTRTLHFSPGAGDVEQALTVSALAAIVSFFTLIPAIVYLRLPQESSMLKKGGAAGGMALLILLVLSLFLPVIPATIMNMTINLTGMNRLTPATYAIPVDKVPVESFELGAWKYKRSADARFYIFEGAVLFSFGDIKLVCPTNTEQAYRDSLGYVFALRKYDDDKRKALQEAAQYCQVFTKSDLHAWTSPPTNA